MNVVIPMEKSPFFELHRCAQHCCGRDGPFEFFGSTPERNGDASSFSACSRRSRLLRQLGPRKSTLHISPRIGLYLRSRHGKL